MQYVAASGNCVIGTIDRNFTGGTDDEILEVYINEDVRAQLSNFISKPPQSEGWATAPNISLTDLVLLAGRCITEGGQPCVFPWKYHDDPTEYKGCANPDGGTGPWCATELTDGKYISDSGKWGYCNLDSCNQTGEVEGFYLDKKEMSFQTFGANDSNAQCLICHSPELKLP